MRLFWRAVAVDKLFHTSPASDFVQLSRLDSKFRRFVALVASTASYRSLHKHPKPQPSTPQNCFSQAPAPVPSPLPAIESQASPGQDHSQDAGMRLDCDLDL